MNAIGGFNAFLATQQRQSGQAKLSLILSDGQVVDIQQVEPLNRDTYNTTVPRGNDSFVDAVGITVIGRDAIA